MTEKPLQQKLAQGRVSGLYTGGQRPNAHFSGSNFQEPFILLAEEWAETQERDVSYSGLAVRELVDQGQSRGPQALVSGHLYFITEPLA